MFNHSLIKRSLVVAMAAGTVAFPAVAQAEYAVDSGGVQSAAPVPVTGPQPDQQPGIDRLQSNVQQWFATHGHFVSPTSTPTSVTAQPGSSFHWGDAGIGAGGAVVLLGASTLGTLAMRRRRPQGRLAS